MRHRPIHWSEGMFLRPQHFQANDRHWEDRVTTSERYDSPYNYGLYEITIDENALAHYQLEVQGCKARMKDGSLIAFDSAHLERMDLRDGVKGPEGLNKLFIDNETVTVFLAIPQAVEGRANVSAANAPEQSRYLSFDLDIDDESAGGNRQPLSFRDLNVRILLSTDDRAGYECLPICRLKKSPKGDDTCVIDPDYFPPVVRLNAWEPLSLKVVRTAYDLLAERLESHAQMIAQHRISMATQDGADIEKMFFLSALNESVANLSNFAFIDGIHPLTAYHALCDVIGRLSIFGNQRSLPEIPKYDHDDLAKIFKWALEQIRLLIYTGGEKEFEMRYFTGSGYGLQVAVDPKWYGKEWELYLGIDPGQVSSKDCLDLLMQRKIDFKLGSAEQVDWIFTNFAGGLKLHTVPQIPKALPSRGNWLYFQISRENEFWRHVELTNSIGVRIKEEQINNLNELKGNRKVIIDAGGKLLGLEWAIFALKKKL